MNRTLTFFLMASVAAHVAVAVYAPPRSSIQPGQQVQGGPLQVVMTTTAVTPVRKNESLTPVVTKTIAAPKYPQHPREAIRATSTHPKPKLATTTPEQPAVPVSVKTGRSSQIASSTSRPATENTTPVRDAVARLLMANFEYPGVAQRRGWQGEVRLGLRVDAQGKLSRIRLLRSSGYSILDRSALRAAKRISTVPDAGLWLTRSHFDMVVPVFYQLRDS